MGQADVPLQARESWESLVSSRSGRAWRGCVGVQYITVSARFCITGTPMQTASPPQFNILELAELLAPRPLRNDRKHVEANGLGQRTAQTIGGQSLTQRRRYAGEQSPQLMNPQRVTEAESLSHYARRHDDQLWSSGITARSGARLHDSGACCDKAAGSTWQKGGGSHRHWPTITESPLLSLKAGETCTGTFLWRFS